MNYKYFIRFFTLYFGLLFIPNSVLAETKSFFSKDEKLKIIQTCNKEKKCGYYYEVKNSKKEKLIIDDVHELPLLWMGNIAQLTLSLGSYNTITFFIDSEKGISIMDGLIDVDNKTKCFAKANEKEICFGKMFRKNNACIYRIKSNDKRFKFMETATLLSVVNGSFSSEGNFNFSYINQYGTELSISIDSPCER